VSGRNPSGCICPVGRIQELCATKLNMMYGQSEARGRHSLIPAGTKTRLVTIRLPVILLAVLAVIAGIQMLISPAYYLSLSAWVRSADGQAALVKLNNQLLTENIGHLLLLMAIVYVVLGLSDFWIALGYLQGRERARHRGRMVAVLAIAFAIVGAVMAAVLPSKFHPGSPFWTILLNVVVFVYLGRPQVLAYFHEKD